MISNDVQKLDLGRLVVLYEIDCTSIGGDIERYHNHTDGPILWQGKEYLPWAIEAKDFERTGDGMQPIPTVAVGNIGIGLDGEPITGVVTALCLELSDLRGATFTRKRTFEKYLDGQPGADPNEHLPDEKWIISQKTKETPDAVIFALSSPLQFDGLKLPSRQIIAGLCGWLTMPSPDGGYRGSYCGYTGGDMFDKDGDPVTDPELDKCGGRVSDCKIRFKEDALRYGGFPNADRTG